MLVARGTGAQATHALFGVAEPLRAVSPSALLPRVKSATSYRDATSFTLVSPVRIAVPSESRRLAEIGDVLGDVIRLRTGFVVHVDAQSRTSAATGVKYASTIRLNASLVAANFDAYTLHGRERSIEIRGASDDGVLWGVQSLRQQLPPRFDDATGVRPGMWSIAAVDLRDAPRFSWRGSMVDVGRPFFPVEAIRRHIDVLSRYKMNVFHWHLMDDQGWRFPVAKYPKLTTVGAWCTEAEGTRYGAFYTREEIRDVVEFARRRGVTVIPEIEMPGHSLAALASYPELGAPVNRSPSRRNGASSRTCTAPATRKRSRSFMPCSTRSENSSRRATSTSAATKCRRIGGAPARAVRR